MQNREFDAIQVYKVQTASLKYYVTTKGFFFLILLFYTKTNIEGGSSLARMALAMNRTRVIFNCP